MSAFSWDSLQIVGHSPDVRGWAETTAITRVAWASDGLELTFSAQATWPNDIYPGFSGPLQFTIWLVQPNGDGWAGMGIIQCWKGLSAAGGDMTDPMQIGKNWVYYANPPMHQPVPGEQIGVFVTQGNQRMTDAHTVAERSNVVFMAWQPGGVFTFADSPIIIVPPSTGGGIPSDSDLAAQVADLQARVLKLETAPAPILPPPTLPATLAHKGDGVTVHATLPFLGNVTAKGTIDS